MTRLSFFKKKRGSKHAKPNEQEKRAPLFGTKKPDGLEVTTTNLISTDPKLQFNDNISVITPVTGMPPDGEGSPDRLRSLGMDPGYHEAPSTGLNNLYSIACSAHDEVSVITSGENSPEKLPTTSKFDLGMANTTEFGPKKLFHPTLPGEDDESKDLSVYEDGSDPSGPILSPGLSPRLEAAACNVEEEKAANVASRKDRLKLTQIIKSKSSWLTRTKYFQKAIDASFDMVDQDKSGDVTLDEMYAGLLLIHLKLAVYVGAPACRPASKQYVSEIFHLLKSDDDDTLDREEFAVVIKILYSQVLSRIVIQWTLTLIIVPILSQYIIKYTNLAFWIAHEFWKDIDDELDPIQRLLYKLWLCFLTITPNWLDSVGRSFARLLCMVPWETWESLPKMILTSLLVFVAVPYALNHVEDFFRRAAHESDAGAGKKAKED
ncbi:hypothetical protein HJC23_011145 [Cyclotella cryptica]|uniref:EF-hand domain-containing protein n=1 Tax=Cyclotella cryptica TaxID=29204 RepID=A0ABD3NUP1_9STRA|eukprot:CCRYP_019613-RA/>CCRYP_019613-RA protein AED:0.40 eAED:0.40 QI:124/1/1/1/0.66/0.5/4/1403/433